MPTPLKSKVWLALPGHKYLLSPYRLYDDSQLIEPVQPFTVSIISGRVAEDLEHYFQGGNDLLIATKSALGGAPLVERVHFYEEDIRPGNIISDLFANNVLIVDEYSGQERLWLEINITEVDTDDRERQATINAFRGLVGQAGAAFPVMVPYVFPFISVVQAINKIFTRLQRDKEVIRVPFALYPPEQMTRGRAPLQVGVYVVFAEAQYGNALKMDDSGTLWTMEDKPADVSYATFAITPGRSQSAEFLQTQQLATLLTRMRSDADNSDRTTFDVLNETLRDYQNFQMLQRYFELASLPDRTEAENQRLRDIARSYRDIRPYLPKLNITG